MKNLIMRVIRYASQLIVENSPQEGTLAVPFTMNQCAATFVFSYYYAHEQK